MLPPTLAGGDAGRLRSDAWAMPKTQVMGMLVANWGSGWEKQFKRFVFTPLASSCVTLGHITDCTRLSVTYSRERRKPHIFTALFASVQNCAGHPFNLSEW